MSFYSSLKYYRPGPPPRLTTEDLADFLIEIEQSGMVEADEEFSLDLKYGESIDVDEKPTRWFEPTEVPFIYTCGEIDWDAELTSYSLVDLANQLRAESRTLSRASGALGQLNDAACQSITREPCEQNEHGFYPEHFGIEIGRVEIHSLGMDEPVHVGWISIEVSGNGYLFPWEPKDIVARAEQSAPLTQLAAICRKRWPTEGALPDRQTIKMRKHLKEAWPYADVRKPLDWCWGTFESG